MSASAVIIRRCRMQNRKFSPKQFVKTRRMRILEAGAEDRPVRRIAPVSEEAMRAPEPEVEEK
ncbi:MAG: hypothetical protein ACLUD2_11025 [Clostridium sp.]